MGKVLTRLFNFHSESYALLSLLAFGHRYFSCLVSNGGD
jgi:hypothetical protein